MAASETASSNVPAEADLRAIGRALWAKKALILGPTLLAAAAALFIVGSLTPLYRSEARIIVENNDTIYTRPEGQQVGEQREADEAAVQSQVQLLLSRDLARQVVNDLKLAEMDEFGADDAAGSLVKRLMVLIGLSRDPMRLSPEERMLDAYYEKLSVYAVPTTRVIVVEFSSENPETASAVANAVANHYLELQQSAKQTTTKKASTWLASQIEELGSRVAEAESKVEAFRTKSNLFLGTNNSTITNQQLGELNTELSRARGQAAEARAKAELIRSALDAGQVVESLDLANSELIRRLSEQRVALSATIAREARTYLPGHPRMKELNAQIDALDGQIKGEASKLARAYENEADVAAGRVASIQTTIDAQKEVAGQENEQEVQLRALEREAKAQRDLLEQFQARYSDAAARERVDAIPPDARIISRATPTNTPYWPKPLAITALTSIGVFVLLVLGVTVSEFMVAPASAGPAVKAAPPSSPAPSAPPQGPSPDLAAGRRPIVRSVPPMASEAPAAARPAESNGSITVFGELAVPKPGVTQAQQVDIEAADMRMLGELAAHLASMPRSEQGALNILTVGSASAIDPGFVALSLARALAGASRKAIVVDAGSGSRDFAAALPNPGEGGLGELIAGKTSFGQAIQRDRASSAHLIAGGAVGLLNAAAYERIGVVFDALGLTYDFVIVLSPSAEKSADMAALAKRTSAAILVSNAQDPATTAAHDALVSAGIGDVVLLLTGSAPARAAEMAS